MKRLYKYLKVVKHLLNTNTLKGLERSTNAPMWDQAESHLVEYNKTIITLSSSALVLSFSIIKIGGLVISKWLLGLSWGLFLLAIGVGIIILFMSFLYNLAAGNIDRLQKEKDFKFDDHVDKPEIIFFWKSRSLMIWLSVAELLFFFAAISTLIITAFLSL